MSVLLVTISFEKILISQMNSSHGLLVRRVFQTKEKKKEMKLKKTEI